MWFLVSTWAFAQEPNVAPAPPLPAEAPAPPAPPAAPAPPRPLTRFESGDRTVFSEISRDVFGMGQSVSVEATVEDNAFLLGQDAQISSPVGGDVFVAAQNVTIDAPVAGDLYAAGQNVVITERGSIGGDVLGAAENFTIDGRVGGDVQVGAGSLSIAAPIDGFVEAEVGALELSDGALINGHLEYSAASEAVIPDGSVKGDVRFTLAEHTEFDMAEEEPSFAGSAFWWLAFTGWSYVAKLALGLLFLAIGGASAARVATSVVDQPAQSFGWGFVVSCVLLVGSLFSMLLILPFPVGVIGLLLFFVLMYGAQVITAQALGDLLLARIRPGATGSPFVSLAVGLLPLVLLASIPWVGNLVWAAATLAGVGALWVASRASAAPVA